MEKREYKEGREGKKEELVDGGLVRGRKEEKEKDEAEGVGEEQMLKGEKRKETGEGGKKEGER